MSGEQLTIWTIRCALALYALVVIHLLLGGRVGRWAKWCWAASCLIFLTHVGLAFHFFHDWSHARAFTHTANETERLLGVRFGHGIYVNHVFAVVWTIDAVMWLLQPTAYAGRAAWLHRVVHSFMFFIAFNGAVIFEDGPVRWAGIVVTVAVTALLIRRRTNDTNGTNDMNDDAWKSREAAVHQ